ncbi:MAG: amidohydrolase family protein [Butyrivibrio sp.]|nr:amidohydrolase family protein [Butyrivibrio sp.]
MKVYVGNIVTVNKQNDVVSYLVEDKGRIVYVGNELPEKYSSVAKVMLGKKALIPSFCDTHQHLASFSLFHAGLNVMECNTNAEILQNIKDFKEKCKDKILIAFGASRYSVEEKKLVTREEIDSVCVEKPVFMVKYDGHACVVNSALLKLVDEKVKNLRGYHPDNGEMNQGAFFAISDYITNSIQIPTLIKNIQGAVDYQASKGIGMIHTVSGVGFPLNMDITLEKLVAKSLQHGFQIRVFPQSLNIKVATSRKLPRIGGCFECALDGCFGSHDAAMNETYTDEIGGNGVLYYSDEKVINFCKAANRAGLQIEMHAIGDKAFDQATRALKAALDDYPRQDHRHGIIHACLPTKEGLEICRQYNIQLPMQIAFDHWKQEPSDYTRSILGEQRNSRLNPIRSFMDAGCIVSFGSDGPCTDPDPIVWLHKAVNHSNPLESVSVQDALRMCTYNGYYATFDEKERGSLEKGKVAYMVILSENPYSVAPDSLKDLKVEKLILSGKEYSPQSRSVVGIIIGGLLSSAKA